MSEIHTTFSTPKGNYSPEIKRAPKILWNISGNTMHITATHINYLILCRRKLWFFTNGINMEHSSDTVYDGRLLHETSYPQRAEKYSEVELSATFNGIGLSGKLDFYDAKGKVIHEIKRSNKVESAHVWQVKFYLWLFSLNGIDRVRAIIEYPLLRQTENVTVNDQDIETLKQLVLKIHDLLGSENCPPVLNAKICKSCSYYELCYVNE